MMKENNGNQEFQWNNINTNTYNNNTYNNNTYNNNNTINNLIVVIIHQQ